MNVMTVLEIVLVALVVLAGVTQLVVPLWRGTPLFPFVRRERRLEAELSEAREEVIEVKLEQRIRQEREAAERLRKPSDS